MLKSVLGLLLLIAWLAVCLAALQGANPLPVPGRLPVPRQGTPQDATQSAKIKLPPLVAVRSTELACEALANTSLQQDREDVSAEQLTAIVSKGTDKLAVKIKARTLIFMTRASVEHGQAEPAEFQILKNNRDYLIAVYLAEGLLGDSISTFVLSKKTGLATWTKSRPDFFTIRTPDTQSFYLSCQ